MRKLFSLSHKKDETSGKWASTIKTIAIVGMVLIALTGTGIGTFVGYTDSEEMAIIGGVLGVIAGVIVGVIAMSLIMFLAELGNNLRITAEVTKKSNTVDETDQILMYKDLLDCGAITLEEFEKKKKELLNL